MTNVKKVTPSVSPVSTQGQTKTFIIGKEWLSSKDGSRPGRIIFSNKLTRPITFNAGDTINRYPNVKRTNADADFTLNINVSLEDWNELMAEQKAA